MKIFTEKLTKRVFLTMSLLVLAFSIVLLGITMLNKTEEEFLLSAEAAELAVTRTYEQFEDGEDNIENTDNVKFRAFFLRDLDGDGYAERIKGTCREVGQSDTLYMELIVQTEGYLKDGKIQINGKNFYFQTALPKDNELKDNYIGYNVKTIEFEDLHSGTQKLLTGLVKSGNYAHASSKAQAIGNNINNYSRDDNKIILTGTYVAEDGTETNITKEIVLNTDWHGGLSTKINQLTQETNDLDDRIDSQNNSLNLSFIVSNEEYKNEILIYSNHVTGTIPELNGYAPIEVTCNENNINFSYNANNREFSISRIAETNDNGSIKSGVLRKNEYVINVSYPLDALRESETSDINLYIPVEAYYEGYNNPNSEFVNPAKSNVATNTIVIRFSYPGGGVVTADIAVGTHVNKPTSREIVKKQKPLRIYNGLSSTETNDRYIVTWNVSTGDEGDRGGIVLAESPDNSKNDMFIKSDNTLVSMDEFTTTVGIGFSRTNDFLEEDGWIKVYDAETNRLILDLNASELKSYTYTNPYYYSTPVKHVRVETSNVNENGTMNIYNIKELDDEYITNNFTKEEFDSFCYIQSYLTFKLGENIEIDRMNQAVYEESFSVADISLDRSELSTQATEYNDHIRITTTADETNNQLGWKNGIFLVKIPKEIIDVELNDVEIDNWGVDVISYEIMEEEKVEYIKIYTQNNNNEPQSYTISLDVNITPNPQALTASCDLELYAINEVGDSYYFNKEDIYDIDKDENLNELVCFRTCGVSLVVPNSLITNQTISEFDDKGTVVVSPKVAYIKPIYGQGDEKATARIGIYMKNNYEKTISEVVVLGKIPFEGNTYVVSGKDLKSEFTTKMKSGGIILPEELDGKVTVYYSDNENPTKTLDDSNNWKLASEVTNWDDIKTFLIDFNDVIIDRGTDYYFYYDIEIPSGVEFNKKAFSHHGIYFSLDTIEGKYRTKTEPNKTGVVIVDNFALDLTKYQIGKDKKVQGATYKVSRLDGNEIVSSKTAMTNSNGLIHMEDLLVETVYEIEEIRTPDEYELNNDRVRFIGHVDGATGEISIEKLNGETRDDIEVITEADGDFVATVNVEDEPKAKLRIIKTSENTEEPLQGVKFKVTGYGLPSTGKILTTNENGEINLSGLRMGREYTVEETKAEGYYPDNNITFKIVNTNGIVDIEIINNEDQIKYSAIEEENDFPVAVIKLANEKIPTYNLEITKIKHETEDVATPTYLEGATFKLYKNNKELGTYVTDSNGKVTIENLYQFDEEKGIDQTYVLKEYKTPDGYTAVKDIEFKVTDNDQSLVFEETLQEGQTEKEYTVEGNTVKLIIEDNPIFKITKTDSETNELLPNTKFAIYNAETGMPATDSKGNIIGNKEVINGKEYNVVITNENGEIVLDLPEGLYKAVEVEADEKYDLTNNEHFFGIGASREWRKDTETVWKRSITGSNSIVAVCGTTDNGSVVVGDYYGNITVGNNTFSNQDYDGIVVKYNETGEVEWAKSISGDKRERLFAVTSTADGGCIVGGQFTSNSITIGNYTLTNKRQNSSYNDVMLIKYNVDGDVEWAKSIGGTDQDCVTSIIETSDGGYAVGGYFISGTITIGNVTLTKEGRTTANGMVIKFNRDNEAEWGRVFGISGADEMACINSLSEMEDGDIIAGGYYIGDTMSVGNYTFTNPGTDTTYDTLAVRLSSNGEIEWADSFGGEKNEQIHAVCGTSDGGFVIAGVFKGTDIAIGNYLLTSHNNGETTDEFLIKYNQSNEIEWIETKEGASSRNTLLVSQTQDGGFIVGGYVDSNCSIGAYDIKKGTYAAKYENDGTIKWATSLGGTTIDIKETSDGDYVACGNFSTNEIIVRFREKDTINIYVKDAQSIGGPSSSTRNGKAKPTSDGGYIELVENTNSITINGQTFSRGKALIKYNEKGKVEWAKKVDSNTILLKTQDEEIIVYERLNRVDRLTIINKTGEIEEYKNLEGDFYTNYVSFKSILKTSDGGFLVGGSFSGSKTVGNTIINSEGGSDGVVIKYDSNGNIQWVKTFGGTFTENITDINETTEGDYVIIGKSSSASIKVDDTTVYNNSNNYSSNGTKYDEGIIVKYSSNGDVKHAQALGGIYEDSLNVVEATSDGGYIIGGHYYGKNITVGPYTLTSNDTNAYCDGMIVKFDKNDTVIWARRIGGNSYRN